MTNLEILRRNAGLSRKRLAELSGVNERTIKSYEAETRSVERAGIEKLMRLSKGLNCSIADIVSREGEEK